MVNSAPFTNQIAPRTSKYPPTKKNNGKVRKYIMGNGHPIHIDLEAGHLFGGKRDKTGGVPSCPFLRKQLIQVLGLDLRRPVLFVRHIHAIEYVDKAKTMGAQKLI